MTEMTVESPKKINIKIIIFSALALIGIFTIIIGFQNNAQISFKASGDNSVNYRVFLKQNDFFDEPYLESGKTYITSLIDHIDIDYKYAQNYSENISGDLSYYLQATISADKTNNPDDDNAYWTKNYTLTEPKSISFENTNLVAFDISTSIDYANYNSILESFHEQYPVASEGTLKVSLIVENTLYNKYFSEPLTYQSESNISLPLLERAIEAKVNVNTGSRTQEFSTKKYKNNLIFIYAKLRGFALIICAAVLIIREILKRREYINHNQYISILNKILDANDSIITNIEKMPNLKQYQKFEVGDFSELLDAYNEIRLPINFYQNKNGTISTFFIASDRIVWIYRLKKRNLGS